LLPFEAVKERIVDMKRTVDTHAWFAIVASLVLVAPAAFAAGAGDGNPNTASASRSHGDSRNAAFVTGLIDAGFIVQKGDLRLVDTLLWVNTQAIVSAQANNAGQYYKRWVVPPHPLQPGVVDGAFRLGPDEAVVYVGKTPPHGDYFSYVLFLWTRHYPDSVLLTGDWLVASVGDPLNNLWIKTETPSDPFAAKTVIIVTADEGVYDQVRKIAGSAGYPDSMVNPLVLPADLLHLGNGFSSDTFQAVIRTANIASKSAQKKYFADDQWGTVYRLTPTKSQALQPFAPPPWRDRAYVNEEALVPGLTAGLERLKAAILASTSHAQARPLESVRWWYDSRDVVLDDPSSPAYRQNVAGESSDTPYLRSAEADEPANFLLGNDDMVVVYGVNHAATGMATYSSFGVYGDWKLNGCPPAQGEPRFVYGCGVPIWNGVVGMTSHAFTGSAEEYIPGDPIAPYLYAVRVVRKARQTPQDPHCVVVPDLKGSRLDQPFYPDVIPLDKPMLIGYRAYVNRATRAGPAYEDVIPDRAIWFRLP
jgi:hypothetical protein